MAETRTHICVYFDDGSLEAACLCGQRAGYVVDDDGAEGVLLLVDDGGTVPAPRVVTRLRREFAISA